MQKLMYKGNGDQEKVSWLVYEFLILFYSYQLISYKLVKVSKEKFVLYQDDTL